MLTQDELDDCHCSNPHCGFCHLPGEYAKLRMKCEALDKEAAPFRPMSIEEAEKAYDEAEPIPLSQEDIERSVRFATDPAFRAEYEREMCKRQFLISRGFKAELESLRLQLAAAKAECETLKESNVILSKHMLDLMVKAGELQGRQD